MFSAQRKAIFSSIPSGYSGLAHLFAVNAMTLGAAAFCASLLGAARAAEWSLFLLFWGVMSFVEWGFHRFILHRRRGGEIFRRPHLSHHVYFTSDAMEFHSRAELKMVLFPLAVFPFLLLATAPLPLLLLASGHSHAALFFELAFSSYYFIYEWAHVMHHAPLPARLAGLWPVAYMRRHHRRHHQRQRMARGNFTGFLPFADAVCGTLLKAER